MGNKSKDTIKCPECGKDIQVEICELADGAMDLKTKSEILDGNFGKTVCSSCGETIDLTSQFVYHDGEKKILIWLLPRGSEEESAAPSEELINASNLLEGCAMRKVRDKNGLREKVLLAEHGKEDSVVELMKVGVYAALQEQVGNKKIVAIFFEFNDEGECFVVQLNTGEVGTIDFPNDMYEGIKAEYGEKIQKEIPRKFSEIDNIWAASFVEKHMTKESNLKKN